VFDPDLRLLGEASDLPTKVLLIVTGANGAIDGYHGKYLRIASRINERYGIPVIRANWPMSLDIDGKNNLLWVMQQCLEWFPNGEFLVMASSNSALWFATLAYQYPQIVKMLLINPATTVNPARQKRGLDETDAAVTVVYGTHDPGYQYVDLIRNNCKAQFVTIPNGDHNLSQLHFEEFAELPERYLLA